MTIATAQAHLQATGEAAAVVLEGGRPVGVVTAAALARAVTKHGLDTPLAVVLDYVAVPVDPQGGAYETIRAFRRAAWDWLEHRQGWR
jgi:CBS domain-containing protein